jgi:hypothetical protein
MERRQLDHRGSYGFNWLRRLWVCGAGRVDNAWKGPVVSDDFSKIDLSYDAPLPPSVADAQFAEDHGVDPAASPADAENQALHDRFASFENQLVAHSLILARIIRHLDPSGTSHTLDVKDLL